MGKHARYVIIKFLERSLNLLLNLQNENILVNEYQSNYYLLIINFPGLQALIRSFILCTERLKSFARNIQKCKMNLK